MHAVHSGELGKARRILVFILGIYRVVGDESAIEWHSRGRGFDSLQLHHIFQEVIHLFG